MHSLLLTSSGFNFSFLFIKEFTKQKKKKTFCENAKGYLGTRDICGKLHTVQNSMALDSSGQVCFLSPEGKPNTQWWSVCVPQQTSAPTLSSVKSNEG